MDQSFGRHANFTLSQNLSFKDRTRQMNKDYLKAYIINRDNSVLHKTSETKIAKGNGKHCITCFYNHLKLQKI